MDYLNNAGKWVLYWLRELFSAQILAVAYLLLKFFPFSALDLGILERVVKSRLKLSDPDSEPETSCQQRTNDTEQGTNRYLH